MSILDRTKAFLLVKPKGAAAEAALNLPHNTSRKLFTLLSSAAQPQPVTPTVIQLTLDNPPIKPSSGHVFGSDPNTCDILLGPNNRTGIGLNAFSVFQHWDSGYVYVRSLTSAKGGITYRQGNETPAPMHKGEEASKKLTFDVPFEVMVGPVNLSLQLVVRRNIQEQKAFSEHFEAYKKTAQNDAITLKSPTIYDLCNLTTPATNVYDGENNTYAVTHDVGQGGFGTVSRACVMDTAEVCALKTFDMDKTKHEDCKGEITLLRCLDHRSIIKFLDSSTEHAPFDQTFLVMEMADGGNLADQHGRFPFSRHESTTILYDISDALSHLHSQNIIHHDVSPRNIVVKTRGPNVLIVKLADFGLSKAKEHVIQAAGLVPYGAPEMFTKTGKFNAKIDVWALGLVLLQYIGNLPKRPEDHGRRSFASDSPYAEGWRGAIREKVQFMRANPTHPYGNDGLLELTVDNMLQHDASDRISASEVFFRLRQRHAHDLTYFLSHPSRLEPSVRPGLPTHWSTDSQYESGVESGAKRHRTQCVPSARKRPDVTSSTIHDFIYSNSAPNSSGSDATINANDNPDPAASIFQLVELGYNDGLRRIDTLKGCSLVNLFHILEIMGLDNAKDKASKSLTDNPSAFWHIKKTGSTMETYIDFAAAGDICKQHFEHLQAGRELLQLFSDLANEEEDPEPQTFRLINAIERKDNALAILENSRLVLVRKTDGHVHVQSLLAAYSGVALTLHHLQDELFIPVDEYTTEVAPIGRKDFDSLREIGTQ